MPRNHQDLSGNKPYKILEQSRTFTLVDGAETEEDAINIANSAVGQYTNAGSSGEWEQYYSALVELDGDVVHRAFPEKK